MLCYMDADPRETRRAFLSLVTLGALTAFAFFETDTIASLLTSSTAGLLGGAAGLCCAAILMVKARGAALRPEILILASGVASSLYALFRALLAQLERVTLPAYLPEGWIEALCKGGIGIVAGGGIPLLLYALVTAVFRLMERSPD